MYSQLVDVQSVGGLVYIPQLLSLLQRQSMLQLVMLAKRSFCLKVYMLSFVGYVAAC
jgi:hypothetical protein